MAVPQEIKSGIIIAAEPQLRTEGSESSASLSWDEKPGMADLPACLPLDPAMLNGGENS